MRRNPLHTACMLQCDNRVLAGSTSVAVAVSLLPLPLPLSLPLFFKALYKS